MILGSFTITEHWKLPKYPLVFDDEMNEYIVCNYVMKY